MRLTAGERKDILSRADPIAFPHSQDPLRNRVCASYCCADTSAVVKMLTKGAEGVLSDVLQVRIVIQPIQCLLSTAE